MLRPIHAHSRLVSKHWKSLLQIFSNHWKRGGRIFQTLEKLDEAVNGGAFVALPGGLSGDIVSNDTIAW
jgi:hypothetical protein